MKRMAALLLGLMAGCSTAPLADVLDFLSPGRLGPERTPPYGGVCVPTAVGPPAAGLPAPSPGVSVPTPPSPAPVGTPLPGSPTVTPPPPAPVGTPLPGPTGTFPPPSAPIGTSPPPLAPGMGTSRPVTPLPPSVTAPPTLPLRPTTASDGPPASFPTGGTSPDIGGPR